jgi:hypothetical protein
MKRSEFDMDHGFYGFNPRPKEKDKKVIPVSEFRKLKVKPEKSLAALKKDLDKVFNAWIRKRDSASNGTFQCISCQEWKPIKQMNAGHFFSAGHNAAIRWHEFNCAGQCIKCNLYLHGNFEGYLKGMIARYGQTVVDALEIQRHNKSRMMAFEVRLLIAEYKEKLKAL